MSSNRVVGVMRRFCGMLVVYLVVALATGPAEAIVFWLDERVPYDQTAQRDRRELLSAAGVIECTDGTRGTGFLIDVAPYLAEGETVRLLISSAKLLIDQNTGFNRAICAFRSASMPDRLIPIGDRLAGWAQVGRMDQNDWVFAKLPDLEQLPPGLMLDFDAAEELDALPEAPLWAVGYNEDEGTVSLTKDCEIAQLRPDPAAPLDPGPLPFIVHDCDLLAGARGGPRATRVENKYRVIGIQVGNGQEENFKELRFLPFDVGRNFFNYGRRLDREMENKLVAFLSRFAELRSPSEAIEARRVLVTAVQANLLRLGYELGGADGLLGHRTREAVRAFQTSLGISPTGQVSEELLLLLQAR